MLQAARREVLAKREREREREREMERLRERERESQRDRERESQRERERAREREREINLNLNLNLNRGREMERERERESERQRESNVGEYEGRRSARRRDSEEETRFLNLEAISRERSGRDSGDGERQDMRSARGRCQAEGGAELFTPRSGSLLSPRSGLASQRSNYAHREREKWVPSPPAPERSEDYVLACFVAKSAPVREIV